MNTFLSIGLSSFENRIAEIDSLLAIARNVRTNPVKYDSICRAIQVLLVGHFEGSIKDMIRNLLDDLSYSLPFRKIPFVTKQSFVTYYMKSEKGGKYDETYRNRLIELFESKNVELKAEPFFFENNKNPSPFIIETLAKRFGITNIFSRFKDSDLDIVFENNYSKTRKLRNKMKNNLELKVQEFPYEIVLSEFNIRDISLPGRTTSLWNDFLDDTLKKRHSIAHGSNLLNESSDIELKIVKTKLEVLLYGLYMVFCHETLKNCT